MNYLEVEKILEELYELIQEDTVIDGTVYESVEELEDDVLNYIEEMRDNSGQWMELLEMHFKAKSTFQMLDEQNNWKVYEDWKQRFGQAKK